MKQTPIIIDDGSNDNSKEIINKYLKNSKVKAIFKKNEGQLSCFIKAAEHITGDIVCLLDSDDVYKTSYIEKVVDFYNKYTDCDMLVYGVEILGEKHKKLDYSVYCPGYLMLRTYFLKKNYEYYTSAMSIKKDIYLKLMNDLKLLIEDWCVMADDCLFMGVALYCGRIYFNNKELI